MAWKVLLKNLRDPKWGISGDRDLQHEYGDCQPIHLNFISTSQFSVKLCDGTSPTANSMDIPLPLDMHQPSNVLCWATLLFRPDSGTRPNQGGCTAPSDWSILNVGALSASDQRALGAGGGIYPFAQCARSMLSRCLHPSGTPKPGISTLVCR